MPRPLSGALAALAFAVSVAAPSSALAQPAPQQLPTLSLTAGFHVVRAQIAATPEQREIGLMYRASMPANEGMLFVFEQPGQQCFWMKNTLLPLSIAFLADDGTVVNIAEMKPQTLDSHCSNKAVRFALEMNQGWFGKAGISAGMKLSGKPFGN